jgi:hypothetical protein
VLTWTSRRTLVIRPPGGDDWVLVRRDGVSQLDVRITLRSEDGSLIFVNYRGLSNIAADIRARIAKGKDVPSSYYYFRITPLFETASDKLAWLNRLVTIGIGKRTAKGVAYDIFAFRFSPKCRLVPYPAE